MKIKRLILFLLAYNFPVVADDSNEIICFNTQSCGNGVVEGGSFNALCMQSCLDLQEANCPGIEACGVGDISSGVIMCDQYKDTESAAFAVKSKVNTAQQQSAAKDFGIIAKSLEATFALPALGKQTSYTYTPSEGALKNQQLVLTIIRELKSFKNGQQEVIQLFVADQLHKEPTLATTIYHHPTSTTLADIRPGGKTLIQPDGTLIIRSVPREPIQFDVAKALEKKS